MYIFGHCWLHPHPCFLISAVQPGSGRDSERTRGGAAVAKGHSRPTSPRGEGTCGQLLLVLPSVTPSPLHSHASLLQIYQQPWGPKESGTQARTASISQASSSGSSHLAGEASCLARALSSQKRHGSSAVCGLFIQLLFRPTMLALPCAGSNTLLERWTIHWQQEKRSRKLHSSRLESAAIYKRLVRPPPCERCP